MHLRRAQVTFIQGNMQVCQSRVPVATTQAKEVMQRRPDDVIWVIERHGNCYDDRRFWANRGTVRDRSEVNTVYADTGECDRVAGRWPIAGILGWTMEKQANGTQPNVEILVRKLYFSEFVHALQIVERRLALRHCLDCSI
ncbi:MAG: hypothetical protein AB7I37_07075 [Pirellulales bacterium]